MADNRSYVYRRLRQELGLTPAQAAGAVGGLGGESGRTLDPNAVNPSSGALGIGQWLGGRARGVRKGDVRQQTNHLIAELKGPERGALNRLRGARNIHDATRAWVESFERPSAAEIASSMPARLGYARDAFNAFHGLKGGGSTGGGATAPAASAGGSTRTTTTITPGVDNRAARAALISSFLEDHNADPVNFAVQANALKDIAPTSTSRTVRLPGSPAAAHSGSASASFSTPKLQSGVANFEGKKVAAWIAPALQYARQHGWSGQVNSGYRSFADQTRIYNSGVRPAARPGTSNHEGTQFPRGAVDVSDAATLSRILQRSPYASRLKWAGAKDPPHFSHPHGGSY